MDAQLRSVCFWIAAFSGATALAAIFFSPIKLILFPATLFVAGTATLLFLRMLFSRAYRQGVDNANQEMQGNDPWPGRPKKLLDPDWGLLGRRAGSPALLWLRAILVLGILPLALLQNWIGLDVVLLWFASAFVSMELSIMHLALSQRS